MSQPDQWWIARKSFGETEAYVFDLTFSRARIGLGKVGKQEFIDEW